MRRNLDGLLFPRSVAVIGASATPGRKSRARSSSPTSRAFPGPGLRREPQTYQEIAGKPCFPTVAGPPRARGLGGQSSSRPKG
jgi:acyl-CoA synthetase (NDP forming)